LAQRLDVAADRSGGSGQQGLKLGAGNFAPLGEDLLRILGEQVVDVDVEHALVRHLAERIAADNPFKVDRGSVKRCAAQTVATRYRGNVKALDSGHLGSRFQSGRGRSFSHTDFL
jgi:hypothetical protein